MCLSIGLINYDSIAFFFIIYNTILLLFINLLVPNCKIILPPTSKTKVPIIYH